MLGSYKGRVKWIGIKRAGQMWIYSRLIGSQRINGIVSPWERLLFAAANDSKIQI